MAKKKSELISAVGILLSVVTALVDAVRKQGGTDEDIYRLATPEGELLVERIAELLVRGKKLVNPFEYFVVGRPGLWFSNMFRDYILAVIKPATALVRKLKHYDLPENMNDTEIVHKLGKGFVFEDASVFCATLARMIDAQSGGEGGDLLNSGGNNIFYVRGKGGRVFATHTYWNADASVNGRRWSIDVYGLDDVQWRAGYRAFSAQSV